MMKVIILSIGLISTINSSSQRLLQQTGCATVRCASGTFCVDDALLGTAQCVSSCDGTTCQTGQSCEEGIGCQDIQCDSFEEYNFCGSACPASCSNQSPGPCIAVCVPGCFCQDGYIRDSRGRCILESECPPSCGTNEVLSQCNGHCRPTCETGPNIICTKQCEAGCNCADGYILDEADGTCIPESDCPTDPEPTLPPGCALILCQVGSTCCDDGNGGATCCPQPSEECPLRCENGFIGCNNCFCDGLGGPGGCTKIGCPPGDTDTGCSKCEVGYTLNTATNTCDSAKVSCTNNGDCDSGFKCRKDPECRAYSDIACANTGKVCVKGRRNDVCTSDSDCDEANGFGCLDGDVGNGRCVNYQN